MAIVAEQDQVLAEMADRTRQIQEATAQRREELNQLRAAREQREVDFSIFKSKSNHTANTYRELQGTKWTQENPLLYKARIYYRKRDPL